MVELTHHDEEATFEDIRLHASDIKVRKITLQDLAQSLREGYEDYGAKPSSVPLLFLFYALFALVFTLFAFGQDLRYLLFPVAAGFTLIGPIVAIAFFCDEQATRTRPRAALARRIQLHSHILFCTNFGLNSANDLALFSLAIHGRINLLQSVRIDDARIHG